MYACRQSYVAAVDAVRAAYASCANNVELVLSSAFRRRGRHQQIIVHRKVYDEVESVWLEIRQPGVENDTFCVFNDPRANVKRVPQVTIFLPETGCRGSETRHCASKTFRP